MSRTNIDYLFQATADTRAFALPRVDEARPPFGDHLSQASASTVTQPSSAVRRNDDRYAPVDVAESSDGEASTISSPPDEVYSDSDSPTAGESQADAADSAGDADGNPSASEETAEDFDDDSEPDEEAELHTEAAAAQAAVNASQPAVQATADGVAELAVETSATVALDETTAGLANVEPDREKATKENGAHASAVVDSVAETSEAASNADPDADGALLGSDAPAPANGGKKSRGRGKSTSAGDETVRDDRRSGAGKGGDVHAGGETFANVDAANTDGQIEQALGEQAVGDALPASSDESPDTRNERHNSRTRADSAANANKIVAAAVNGAAAIAGDNLANPGSSDDPKTAKQIMAKSDVLTTAAGRLHGQQAAGRRGAKADGADDMPRVDAARFVGRVAKAFQTAHERGGTLQLRLSPPELGALRLELTVKDGVMTAALETENATTRRVLLDHLPALRERLAEQNIRVERFDVDVRRDGGGQQDTAPQNQQHQRQHHPESRRQAAMQTRSEDTQRHERTTIQPLSNNSGINLVA